MSDETIILDMTNPTDACILVNSLKERIRELEFQLANARSDAIGEVILLLSELGLSKATTEILRARLQELDK